MTGLFKKEMVENSPLWRGIKGEDEYWINFWGSSPQPPSEGGVIELLLTSLSFGTRSDLLLLVVGQFEPFLYLSADRWFTELEGEKIVWRKFC